VNSRTTAIVVGGVLGAVVGAAAAWTYIRQQETELPASALGVRKPVEMQAGAGDLIKMGVALLALLRQFDDLFKPK